MASHSSAATRADDERVSDVYGGVRRTALPEHERGEVVEHRRGEQDHRDHEPDTGVHVEVVRRAERRDRRSRARRDPCQHEVVDALLIKEQLRAGCHPEDDRGDRPAPRSDDPEESGEGPEQSQRRGDQGEDGEELWSEIHLRCVTGVE
jgi:hypothetical protein